MNKKIFQKILAIVLVPLVFFMQPVSFATADMMGMPGSQTNSPTPEIQVDSAQASAPAPTQEANAPMANQPTSLQGMMGGPLSAAATAPTSAAPTSAVPAVAVAPATTEPEEAAAPEDTSDTALMPEAETESEPVAEAETALAPEAAVAPEAATAPEAAAASEAAEAAEIIIPPVPPDIGTLNELMTVFGIYSVDEGLGTKVSNFRMVGTELVPYTTYVVWDSMYGPTQYTAGDGTLVGSTHAWQETYEVYFDTTTGANVWTRVYQSAVEAVRVELNVPNDPSDTRTPVLMCGARYTYVSSVDTPPWPGGCKDPY